MSKMKSLSYSLSAVALVCASPAFADITADQLWSIWQDQATEFGYNMNATATPTDTGLTLSNVSNTIMVEQIQITGTIDSVTMTNQADGTVAITTSDRLTYRVTGFEGHDAPDAMNVIVGLDGLNATASGNPTSFTIASQFNQIAVQDVTFEGIDPSEVPEMTYDISLDGYSATATYDLSDPAVTAFTSTATLDALTLALDMLEPGNTGGAPAPAPTPAPMPAPEPTSPAPGKFVTPDAATPMPAPGGMTESSADGHLDASIQMAGLQATSQGVMPRGVNWMALDHFPAGMSVSGDTNYTSASLDFMFHENGETTSIATRNTGGAVSFGLSQQAVNFSVSATGVGFDMAVPDMPFPVAASAESTALSFALPLAREDQPSSFSAAIAYRGVTMDDSLWAMFDPGQAVPRTPASIVVDLSGTVQLFADILMMSPEDLDNMTAPPGELRSMTLNELDVSVGGAQLTGTGDVTFAPGQVMPMPVGTVDLSLTGANGLIQNLSDGGLLPPQQAGMARGMLGMFAIPGAEADSFTSTIEFTPDGMVTANGVPLQ